ncbi:retention module-containing protein [Litorivicinus lipolyticus]|uniref:retention module-containing protein n=1 Tax=Litorivicinus lipolyticus TaxID=418701 RepID=UPI0014794B69|nr:retention module-containing protein [Litorivicinus lipolyticus]
MAISSSEIGIAEQLVSQPILIDVNGQQSILRPGDAVPLGATIQTDNLSSVTVVMANGLRFDVGRNSEFVLEETGANEALLLQVAAEDELDNVELIQALIAAGADPFDLLDATAAGPAAGSINNAGGTDTNSVDRTGPTTQPGTDFETFGADGAGLRFGAGTLEGGNLAPVGANITLGLLEGAGEGVALALFGGATVVSDPDNVTGDLLVTFEVPGADVGQFSLPDGTPLTPGSTASVSGNDFNGLLFTPSPDSNNEQTGGPIVLAYSVEDPSGASDTGSVTINVSPVNDAPILAVTDLSASEDGVSVSGTPTFADVDVSDEHSFTVTQPAEGTVTIDAETGEYTFVPGTGFQDLAAGETRVVTFDVTVTDDSGAANAGATETVSVTVTGTNDAPTLVITDLAASEDGAGVSGTPTFADVDVSDEHSFTVTQPAEGTVTIDTETGEYTFAAGTGFQDLAAGETRIVTFDVSVTDDSGAANAGATQTVSVTVTGTHDAPIIKTALSTTGLAVEYYGVDSQINNLSEFKSIVSGNPADATFTSSGPNYAVGSGTVSSGNHLQNWMGGDAASLSNDPASTSDGGLYMHGQVYLEAGSYTFKSYTDDGLELTINGENAGTYAGNRAPGTTIDATPVVIAEAGYVPVELFWWDQGGRYVLEVGVSKDGGEFVAFTTDNFAMSSDIVLTESDTGLTTVGSFEVCDVDLTNQVSATIDTTQVTTSGFDIGALDVSAMLSLTGSSPVVSDDATEGRVDFEFDSVNEAFDFLPEGAMLTLTYPVSITDGTATVTQNVVITIVGTNEAAIIGGDSSGSAIEGDVPVVISGTLTATDVDNLDDSFSAETLVGANGSLTITDGGAWTYTAASAFDGLAAGEVLSETFTVTSIDGTEHDIVVSITGTNDAPVAQDFSVALGSADNAAVDFAIDQRVTDAEDDSNPADTPTVVIQSDPSLGVLIDGQGNLVGVGDTVSLSELTYAVDPQLITDGSVMLGATALVNAGLDSWGMAVGQARELDLGAGVKVVTSVANGDGALDLAQYSTGSGHIGFGVADATGSGLNSGEVITVDFVGAMATGFSAGLDGMGNHFVPTGSWVVVTVTYTDGTSDSASYQKPAASVDLFHEVVVGNSASAFINTGGLLIDKVEFGTDTSGIYNGSNWELRYLDADLDLSDSFDYAPVDSGGLAGNTATVSIDGVEGGLVIATHSNDPIVESLIEGDEALVVDNGEIVTSSLLAAPGALIDGDGIGIELTDVSQAGGFTFYADNLSVDVAGDGSVSYRYDSGDETFDDLDVGESAEATFTVTLSDGVRTVTQDIVINVAGTNDGPVFEVDPVARNAGYDAPQASTGGVALWENSISINTVEGGQSINQLVLSVEGVVDGAAEVLQAYGKIPLLDGAAGSIVYKSVGYGFNVEASADGLLTVTLKPTASSGWLVSDVEDFIGNLCYVHTDAGAQTIGLRSITIDSMSDTGSAGDIAHTTARAFDDLTSDVWVGTQLVDSGQDNIHSGAGNLADGDHGGTSATEMIVFSDMTDAAIAGDANGGAYENDSLLLSGNGGDDLFVAIDRDLGGNPIKAVIDDFEALLGDDSAVGDDSLDLSSLFTDDTAVGSVDASGTDTVVTVNAGVGGELLASVTLEGLDLDGSTSFQQLVDENIIKIV